MIVAAVAAGQGFALMTPSLLIDGFAEGLTVEEVQAVTEPRLITATPPGTIAL